VIDEIVIEEGAVVETADYRRLREAVGWGGPRVDDASLAAALARTWNVLARRGDEVVGLARLLDDGAVYATIWDMIVLPELQRRGIGDALLSRLLARAKGRSIVALVATELGRPLYERHGFVVESGRSVGMIRRG
jgi:GNAT superfamily N-acetyltransferase